MSPLDEAEFVRDCAGGTVPPGRFIAGPENRVLLRAIEDFCTSPTCPYNPLVLNGPSGIGKTLLARDIARRIGPARDGARVVFLTGADFAAEYAQAVESRDIPAWREATRDVALLVLDDLGPLAAKRPAQVELIQTVDSVIACGGQVLVTAPQPVSAIAGLLPALAGRLCGGLAVDIALPGPAARRAALLHAAAEREMPIKADAAALLANESPVTIPALYGALHELHAACRGAHPIERAQVQRYLHGRRAANCLTVRRIATCAARHHGLQVADLRGPSRRQNIVTARATAMYLARQLTGKSLGAVGKYFGGRDHTTVLHACRKTEESMAADAGLRQSVKDLRIMLQEG